MADPTGLSNIDAGNIFNNIPIIGGMGSGGLSGITAWIDGLTKMNSLETMGYLCIMLALVTISIDVWAILESSKIRRK